MRFASLFLAAAAAAPLGAQNAPTIELYTDSAVAAFATDGTTTDFETVPAKTQLFGATKGINMWPKVSSSGKAYASIPVLAYTNHAGTGVNLLERGYCRGGKGVAGGTSSSTSKTSIKQGPHSYIVRIVGQKGTAGAVYVSWHSKAVLGAKIGGTVDIGNDNSVEYTGKANVAERKTFPYVLGSKPLEIKVTIDGSVQGTGKYDDYVNYFVDCFVGFTVDRTTKCTLTPYGKGCGPTLQGGSQLIGNDHVVQLKCTGGFANGWALHIIGTQAIKLSLPGNCDLLSNALVLTLIKADNSGTSSESFKIRSTDRVTSYHQFLPMDVFNNQLILKASNGIKLECKR